MRIMKPLHLRWLATLGLGLALVTSGCNTGSSGPTYPSVDANKADSGGAAAKKGKPGGAVNSLIEKPMD